MSDPTRPTEVDLIRAALQESTSAARTAEASANALSLTINGTDAKPGLKARLEENTAEVARLARRDFLQWLTIAVVVVGLVFGGWAFWRFNSYQDCVNHTNSEFFSKEKAKVSGQIAGVNEIERDPRAGIAQFKAASQHYLDAIGQIDGKC